MSHLWTEVIRWNKKIRWEDIMGGTLTKQILERKWIISLKVRYSDLSSAQKEGPHQSCDQSWCYQELSEWADARPKTFGNNPSNGDQQRGWVINRNAARHLEQSLADSTEEWISIPLLSIGYCLSFSRVVGRAGGNPRWVGREAGHAGLTFTSTINLGSANPQSAYLWTVGGSQTTQGEHANSRKTQSPNQDSNWEPSYLLAVRWQYRCAAWDWKCAACFDRYHL